MESVEHQFAITFVRSVALVMQVPVYTGILLLVFLIFNITFARPYICYSWYAPPPSHRKKGGGDGRWGGGMRYMRHE